MIFARRKGAVSGEQRDGDEFSDMVESRDIVNGRRSSAVGRRPSAKAKSIKPAFQDALDGKLGLPSKSLVSIDCKSFNDIVYR